MVKAAAVLLLAAPLWAAPAPGSAPVALDPPSGWTDVTARTPVAGLVLALKGPVASSFALARMPESALDNPAATRAYLSRLLDGVRAGSGQDYRAGAPVETRIFRNGVTARLLRASLDGRPRLVLAVLEAAGSPPLAATLSSAAPDAMMESLFGAIRVLAPPPVTDSGTVVSLDGQLQLALGGGLRSRALTGPEMQHGVVLAVEGGGSEVVFLKLPDDDSPPTDEPRLVRATVADAVQAPLSAVSPAAAAPTPAGPAAVTAWAETPGPRGRRFAAGFLPWSYWGYSVLARGPQADELLRGVLAALKQGPSAVPKLVAASPVIAIPPPGADRRLLLGAAAAAALIAVLLAWSRARKKDTLPS